MKEKKCGGGGKKIHCVVVVKKSTVILPPKYKESHCLQIPIQEAPRPLHVALLLFCHESCHFFAGKTYIILYQRRFGSQDVVKKCSK